MRLSFKRLATPEVRLIINKTACCFFFLKFVPFDRLHGHRVIPLPGLPPSAGLTEGALRAPLLGRWPRGYPGKGPEAGRRRAARGGTQTARTAAVGGRQLRGYAREPCHGRAMADRFPFKMSISNNFRCISRSAHFQVRQGRQYIHF